MSLIDLAQLESLQLGAGPWVVQVSEDTLNLALCAMSTLDDRDEWETDSEELDDAGWAEAIEMLSLAQWELTEEVGVGGEVYVDRGDPAGYDFSTADFTRDGAWHALALSNIITDTDATAVHISVLFKDNLAGSWAQFRKNGNIYGYNHLVYYTAAANVYASMDGTVCVDIDRKIAYAIIAGMDEISFVVRGWLKPAS
jgi:hypothetical protein